MANDFIWYREGIYTQEFCQSVISYYEQMVGAGYGVDRKSEKLNKIKKDDITVFPTEGAVICLTATQQISSRINEQFWNRCYREYADTFDILSDFGFHTVYCQRIQKTKIGGGYHMWHPENATRQTNGRVLAFTIYLNDVEEGGETEFLYYPKRVKPKTGAVLIFPSGFTHTHRGNPPISNEKYIVTGWVEF